VTGEVRTSTDKFVFFDALPTIDVVMPPLAMTAIEEIPHSSCSQRTVPVRIARRRRRTRNAPVSPRQPRRFFDGFNQPAALSEMNELPQLVHLARCGQLR
jgi:hypothetical protein